MTQEEKNMISEIDKKLSEINSSSGFSDTNLVAKNIEMITQKEKTEFSYIYKCFIVLIFILFSLRVNKIFISGC